MARDPTEASQHRHGPGTVPAGKAGHESRSVSCTRSEWISSRPGGGKTTTTYRATREFFYASLVAPKEASMAPFRLEVEALEIAQVIVGECCDFAAYAVDIAPGS